MTGDARKLATIVALDAAGYSRQSEIDEAVAVREISALSARVRASAQAHGGRVFNAAGDGFMVEFPSASGAAAFAEEVTAGSRVPLRVGVHLGEVTETSERDLLGRGVNVAARLQTLAAPGEIAMSGEVRKALGQPLADRLEARGLVKLDKMDERIELFVLRSPWRAPSRLPRVSPRTMMIAGAAAALVLLLAAGAMLPPEAFQRRSERVAVLDFEAIGEDAALPALARSLADQIVAVMSTSDLQTAPRADSESFRGEQLPRSARAANVAFVLDGTIRQDADTLRVSMHVIDARENLTLWSNTYARATADAAALQEQVAAHAAGILRCALISRRPRAGAIDPQTLSIFLRACDRVANFDRPPEEMVTIARQVTERAPRFSRGWSMLAMATAFASRGAAAAEAEALTQASREAAERARRLDRNNAEILLAEAVLLPSLGHWNERQDLITRALELEPESADALMLQGELLAEQGRLNEAVTYFRRALAVEPLSPSYWAVIFPALGAAGRMEEANEYSERLLRVWPDSPSGPFNRFASQSLIGDPREALAMIDPPNPIIRLPSATHASWRRWLVARRDRDRAAEHAAAHEIAEVARRGEMDLPRAAAIASASGELDLAFGLTREHLRRAARVAQPIGGAGRYFQFMPATSAMRRDPRFMTLMREMGLVAHWLETDRWPDFCVAEQIPYDCEEEARRAS